MQRCLADLLELAGAWPKEKATRTILRRLTFSSQQRRVMFLATSAESYSAPEGHVVSLFFPKAGRLERLLQTGRRTPLNETCRVGCSCQAWTFWGAAYKSTQEEYRPSGPEWREDRAPAERDPHGQYWICKHVIRVAENLAGITFADLAAQGVVPTALHAQSSLDAVRPTIASFMAAADAGDGTLDPYVLQPDHAEEVMTSLRMLCVLE